MIRTGSPAGPIIHVNGHEHIWQVHTWTRHASGDFHIISRCRCGVERHAVASELPDEVTP